MGQIDIYPTLLNLLGLEKFRGAVIGQSILDPRKPGIAISPKRKIEGDTLHISADELLRMQQSQVISDRIIRFDKLKGSTIADTSEVILLFQACFSLFRLYSDCYDLGYEIILHLKNE